MNTPFKATCYALSILFCATAILAACTTKETRDNIDKSSSEAQQELTQARQPQPDAHRYDPLVVSDKVWSGNSSFRMHRGMPLPARYETAHGITIVSSEPMSLAEIGSAITWQTGIPVRVMDAGRVGSTGASSSSPPSGLGSLAAGIGSAVSGIGGGTGAATSPSLPPPSSFPSPSSSAMPVSYEGPMSGLLEKAAGYFNVDWRYDGTSIEIVRFETRVFLIEALPQSATMQDSSQGSSSNGGGGGGGGGGGSSGGGSSGGGGGGSSGGGSSVSSSGALSQNVAYTGTIKYWDELKETLTAMLAGTGSIIVSPSSGEVTVTTTPEVMHTIANYLAQENRRISRQIAINVEVFSIDLNQGEDYSMNPSLILNKIGLFGHGSVFNLNYTGAGAPTSVGSLSNLSSLSLSILNPNNANYPIPASDIVSALSSIGDVSQVAQFPMVTLNNRPVSRFVGTSTSYVPSVSSNSLASVATTGVESETVTTSTINSGFTIQLQPRLLDDGRIMMQYSLNIAGTPTFQYFNSCTGTSMPSTTSSTCPSVQLPTQASRSFIQQSVLHSGSTLMIGGIDEQQSSQNAQGPGSPYNALLGGGISNGTIRTLVFIAITPQVLDDSMPVKELSQ